MNEEALQSLANYAALVDPAFNPRIRPFVRVLEDVAVDHVATSWVNGIIETKRGLKLKDPFSQREMCNTLVHINTYNWVNGIIETKRGLKLKDPFHRGKCAILLYI